MRWQIAKQEIFYAIVLLIWVPIGAITYGIPHGTQFLMIIRMMLSVAIIIKYARIRVFRLDCATLVGYFLCVCISTLICQRGNSLNLLKSIEYVTFIWATVKFFYCMKQQEWIKFLRAAKNIGYFYIIGSLLSNILYLMTHTVRNYQGTWFFLGSRAETVQTEVLMLACIILYQVFVHEDTKIKVYAPMILCLLDAILFKSGQGITMFFVIIGSWIMFDKKSKAFLKVCSPIVITATIIGLNYLILSGIYQNISLIIAYITRVLGKSTNLTGRNVIFEVATQLIYKSPLWGYGYNNNIISTTIGGINTAFNSAHNSILDVFLNTGIISCVFLALSSFLVEKKLFENAINNKGSLILYFSICAYYVGGLVNLAVASKFFWILLAISIGWSQEKMDEKNLQGRIL
ncbi:O-antigen ligase family protein [Mediterraneibacter faecis]|uniref:O-antigen ligase family protein n=1 Tax=Mediterraneibacter faecis TaxID=592978 RepID=UPI003F96D193